jgi:prepilin-type N-terminal cleavage/methylation domain-containing protein
MKIKVYKKKYSGFTLLELVVVMAVMGLMSTMAMDLYTDNSNQKRFELTKQRLAEIKFAIIGDPQMKVGTQVILKGYYYDMNRLPRTLSELIYQCRSSMYIGLSKFNKVACETTVGNVWENHWAGPYLNNIQSENGHLIFRDGWGNTNADGNFGWTVSNPSVENFLVRSKGLNRKENTTGSNNQYENDYPTSISNLLVTQSEVNNIKNLRKIQLSGYCVNTTTKNINESVKDQFLCTETWTNTPSVSGYCVDKAAGTIDPSIITSASCTAADTSWQKI